MAIPTTIRLGDGEISRVGLGTNRLTNTPHNVAFVRSAAEAGIGMIDTAHLYTGGMSEATIGAALGSDHPRVVVATKGGFQRGQGRRDVLSAQIEQSLRSLRSDTIDLYYLHRVDPETPLEESVSVIREFVDRGSIRLVGLSEVGVDEIVRARRIVPIAAVQNQYNLSDRGWDEVVDYSEREAIVFVPFFPLRGTGGFALLRVAERRSVTANQVALAWLLHRSPQILPIPGTLSIEHLRENVAALPIELSDEELASLAAR
jgi:aryl-alcohol dehydrogenase-like predicted oxidoreductase